MNTRHKWADVIIAFVEGKKIQFDAGHGWEDWDETWHFPSFNNYEWRIKPAEPVVRWQWICKDKYNGRWFRCGIFLTDVEADDYFESVKVAARFKDESSRTEFPAEDNT